jgi:hypothetical protein
LKPTRYLSAEGLSEDDFHEPFTNEAGEVVYDGATRDGTWATMTEQSFRRFGVGLGVGRGQKYVRQPNGQLHKVEG